VCAGSVKTEMRRVMIESPVSAMVNEALGDCAETVAARAATVASETRYRLI
jgi:hypothetical protein